MRVHQVGLDRSEGAGPRTIVCYLLRFTDRDHILQAAREAARGEEGLPRHESGRMITFSTDYSNFTISHQQEFSTTMDEARKQNYLAFLLFPDAKQRFCPLYFQHPQGSPGLEKEDDSTPRSPGTVSWTEYVNRSALELLLTIAVYLNSSQVGTPPLGQCFPND